MFFFGSKIERELSGYCKTSPEIEIKFVNSLKPIQSRILSVNRNNFVVLGFDAASLTERNLDVRIISNQRSFTVRILKAGRDLKGRTVFSCSLPKEINATWIRQEERYFIYPNGVLRFMIDTNKGRKSFTTSIWDISSVGLSIIHPGNIEFRVGTKIFQAFIKVRDEEAHIMDLQVRNIRTQMVGNQKKVIMGCLFKSKSAVLDKMLLASRRIDAEMGGKMAM